jgi:integrase
MTCRHCGKPLTRRDGETAGNFKRRQFCDRDCMSAAFRVAEPGEDTAPLAKRARVRGSLSIDIRLRQVGRLTLSAHTTNAKLRDQREASVRKVIERGDLDVIAALRQRRLHITEIDAAVRDGDFARLKATAGAPCDTLGVAVRKLLRTVRATKEPSTYRLYAGLCRALERSIGKATSLDAITAERAEAFLHGPQLRGRPWNPRAQRQATQVYRRVWTRGNARTQPWGAVELPRKRKVRVAFLQPAEWRALAARHAGLSELAILALGALAGLRMGEIIHLRPDIDVDLVRRVIHIQPRAGEYAWKPKTDNSVRDVPICDELFAILAAHINDGYAGGRYLIRVPGHDRPVSKAYLAGRVQAACERVGIRWGREGDGITTHSLRHTFASWLAQRDVQLLKVAQLMGDDVATVALYYAHLTPQDLGRAVAHLDEVVRAA